MSRSQWFRPPRRLPVLFLAITMILAAALGWLSWRLLEQDRALESQRIQERLEHAADLIGTALDRRLSEIADRLPTLAEPAEDALIVVFDPYQIEAHPRNRLLYYPFVPRVQEASESLFEAGEALEFREEDYPGAIAVFRRLARSRDPLVQAGALVRLGRNLRKNVQLREALPVYEELAQLGLTPVGGGPAELLARQAICEVLRELGRFSDLQRAAGALYADLQQSRWQLDRVSYQFHSQVARGFLGSDLDRPAERQTALALAAGIESLWDQWQVIRRGEGNPRGRRSIWVHDRSILLVWDSAPERMVALAAGPTYVESQWSAAWVGLGVTLALIDSEARSVVGQPLQAGQPQAVRTAAETRLPWTLRVASVDPASDLEQLVGRRRFLLGGLAMMSILLLTGGYFTARAAARELAVARLQSDFVSAVSHEFRTPLTSMRHLTELLDRGVVSEEDRRRQYYAALSRETTRLHRLVESLLNLGRMEAGALEYRFEPADIFRLVAEVVADFKQELAATDHQIELAADHDLPELRIDHEALARAMWNLLDNAVKYSPGKPAVQVNLTREGNRVAISVSDQGLGIPVGEQKEIFNKFVRGAAARESNVKGTGVGLAMVRHSVRAHGGEVLVQSRPGEGSTFTILLPVGGRTR